MNINNLFFQIHYCNGRSVNEPRNHLKMVTRPLQHHELNLLLKEKDIL